MKRSSTGFTVATFRRSFSTILSIVTTCGYAAKATSNGNGYVEESSVSSTSANIQSIDSYKTWYIALGTA